MSVRACGIGGDGALIVIARTAVVVCLLAEHTEKVEQLSMVWGRSKKRTAERLRAGIVRKHHCLQHEHLRLHIVQMLLRNRRKHSCGLLKAALKDQHAGESLGQLKRGGIALEPLL